jgi:DNA-binding CsgD family transcriptional regulator
MTFQDPWMAGTLKHFLQRCGKQRLFVLPSDRSLRSLHNQGLIRKTLSSMLSKELTNKEIGRILQISQYTVRNHINHITAKLEVCDRTEATTVALQQGILSASQ